MTPPTAGSLMAGLDVLEALGGVSNPVGVSELARLVKADERAVER